MLDYEGARRALEAVGQGHVLAFWEALSEGEREGLLRQIGSIDLSALPGLVERYVRERPVVRPEGAIEPPVTYALDGGWDRGRYREIGEEVIRAGKVAALVVAGGQGTRLGLDGPKGALPITPVRRRPLFAVFAEGILAAERRYGCEIPWYVMTSLQNRGATEALFEREGWFGLEPSRVRFFVQGEMPSLDKRTGRMLLADRGRIAMNPDGHGGSIVAMGREGVLAEMRRRGVEQVSYFQVDNPLVRVIDPVFIGLHVGAPDSSGEMTSKMIRKAYAEEKIGVLCRIGGRTHVIEYSDLPEELARARGEDGSLLYAAGNPAIHVMSVGFLERLCEGGAAALPWHRAEKKVRCVDPETGEVVDPAEPNAVKLERFVFDALPHCRSSVVLEIERAEEFAPVKNATGTDSVQSAVRMQVARAARWIEAAGGEVPRREDGEPDCVLEISPLTALGPEDLVGRAVRIERGAAVAL